MAYTGTKAATPRWYWAVAALAVLWELAGCVAYVTQVSMSPADMAALPAAQRDIWQATPTWVTAAYAIAVWSGLAGGVGLLLRRRWARPAFIVSLIAVLIQFGWTFLATDILRTMPLADSAPFPAFIVGAALLTVWFSSFAVKTGWLR